MNYNFDERVSRLGTNSYKWDSADSGHVDYPLWVADMDFRVPEPIVQALHQRVEHGIFGYVTIPRSIGEAVCRWFEHRHHWTIDPSMIVTAPGIVPAITAILRTLRLSKPNQQLRVVLHTPAYNCFFNCIHNAGATLVETPLERIDNHYEMDWQNLDDSLAEADVLIFCNPHNPSGRVWTRDEIAHVANLCRKHDVLVISDEIHAEFAWRDIRPYTPFATLADRLNYIIMTSAGKAFNIAGLQNANIVCGNEQMLRLVEKAMADHHLEDINPFGLIAVQTAYNECEDWLDQLNTYIHGNYTALCDWFSTHAPSYHVTRMEGTYLAWVDCREALCSPEMQARHITTTTELCQYLIDHASVKFNDGAMYGLEGYIRINMACSRSFLLEALEHAFVQP